VIRGLVDAVERSNDAVPDAGHTLPDRHAPEVKSNPAWQLGLL
jgi:hypothetical protein